MLKLNEIFFSAQGEGARVGIPSLFIRLSGCSAQCPYCDSKESWNSGKLYNETEIIKIVNSYKKTYNSFQIVITGGEPFEQDIEDLVRRLKEERYFIAIETNGKTYIDTGIDWYAVSPKDQYNYIIDPNIRNKINEVKLIVNNNLRIDVIKKIRAIDKNFPIFLQPDFFNPNRFKDTYSLYMNCIKSDIENLRLGFQLHRVYDIE